MIETWRVREALRPRFGSVLMDEPGVPDRAAALLCSYAAYKDTFSDMTEDIISADPEPAAATEETNGKKKKKGLGVKKTKKNLMIKIAIMIPSI